MAIEGVRDRVGSLGSTRIRLAQTSRPYKHFYVNSVRERQDQAGTDVRSEVQRVDVREWKLDDWMGGFGNPVWRSDQANRYNTGRHVVPQYRTVSTGGLVLGPSVATTGDDTPAADFTPVSDNRVWLARNPGSTSTTVWAPKTRALHPWLPSTQLWDATAVTAGPVAGVPVQVADPDDGFLYVLDNTDSDIYQVNPTGAANNLHVDRSAVGSIWANNADNFGLAAYRGQVYLLTTAGDLYRINPAATNDVTQVVDAYYSGFINTGDHYARLATNDVGLVWYRETVNGTDVWEYNAIEDSDRIIHQIPGPVYPWGIATVGGFVFIGYSSSTASESPNAYIDYVREGQVGTLGPIVTESESYAVSIAGAYQNRYLVVHVAEVNSPDDPWQAFVYDLKEAAWHHWVSGALGTSTHSVAPGPPRIVGRDMLVPSSSGVATYRIEHVDFEEYSTAAAGEAYLDTGRYDFDLPGTQKALVDITVITDPLPANTSIQLQYSLDGDAFAGSGLDITTDGATSTTFSFATSNLLFYELELRILLNSTTTSATPTVRSVTARAFPTSVQEYWDIDVDLNPQRYEVSSGGDQVTPQAIIAALENLKTAQATVTFTNPWQTDTPNGESALSDTVWVVSVEVPDIGGTEANRYARVRLMRAALS